MAGQSHRRATGVSLPTKIFGAFVCGAIVLGAWVFFAPMKLGGSTTFAVTSGISMEPLLHKNDLAFVRTQSSYQVGDIVLYQSQVVHRPVLHRIILIQDGHYFFKGDNNDFVDPGYATRGELTGTLWFSVPAVGAVLAWFGKPAHAALLAALATMAIALIGMTTTKSRRRRRKGPRTMIAPPHQTNPMPLPTREVPEVIRPIAKGGYKRRPSPYFEGPMPSLAALGVVLLLTLVFLIMGFTRPVHRTGVLAKAYNQTGTFSYSAVPKASTAVYPSGLAKTGDPIYPSLIDILSVRFEYVFSSALAHNIEGTIELKALVLSTTDTWQEVATVAPAAAFSGDTSSTTTDFALSDLYSLIDSVIADTGIAGTNYSVDLQPIVHIAGTVGDQSIDETFSPVLPFAVSRTAIRVDAPVSALPAGATYTPTSTSSALAAVLNPAQAGGIPHVVANDLSIAKYKVPVAALRVLGTAFCVLALALALVHDRLRRRMPRRSEEENIAKRFHALIVPVADLGSAERRMAIAVPDFANLAGLARFLERPILYEVRDGKRTFAVDDDAVRYLTAAIDRRGARPVSDTPRSDMAATAPDPHPMPTDTRAHRKEVANSVPATGRSRRATLARGAAGLFVLAVATTLTMSFTASTKVPPSNAGLDFIGGAVDQGAPAGCSSLGLTTLVTGQGTFSSSASHALILGSAGVDTINSTGQSNCIIGGGGRDRVTGKSTSVCITGPDSRATYTTCIKKAQ